jgi:hypothetical protein
MPVRAEPMTNSQVDAEIIAQLERHGEAQARLMIASGAFPTQHNVLALKWLAEKDQEARRRNAADQAEQNRIARSSQTAAWVAAIAAIVAAILAATAAIIAYLSWVHPHQPS